MNHWVVDDGSLNAPSDSDEEEDQSSALLLGAGTPVSQEEETTGGDEVVWGKALELWFLVNGGVGKPIDGVDACPVLPTPCPDAVAPTLTAVSFPLHGGPGLRILFASPVWIAGRGIFGWANQVEASSGSLVDDCSGGKVPVVIEMQLVCVELSLGFP